VESTSNLYFEQIKNIQNTYVFAKHIHDFSYHSLNNMVYQLFEWNLYCIRHHK
jgi:hypothetical protein